MKYLTLGLLLLNLLVFAWLQTQPGPFGGTARVSPLSGEQLVLLAEQPDAPALEPANERVAPRVTFVGVACYSLGPFVSEAGAREANETLAGLGLATQQREGTRRELTGYWVYIPPLLSRDEAREVTAMLKARGVKDFQIVSTGPKKNAISLGFFRSQDSAEQHYARISALGLNPVKEENYKENSGLWLDFSSPNRPPLPEAIVDALQQQYGGIAMHERNCS